MTHLANATGRARPEGGREAPALVGGSGAARPLAGRYRKAEGCYV